MKLLAFDFETTGIDVKTDRPVQISAIIQDAGSRRIMLNQRCNPMMSIAEGASNVHGIRNEQVQHAPDFVMACWTFVTLVDLVRPDCLVTYNGARFDLPMLNNIMGQACLSAFPHLDVMQVAYRYFPTEESHKLGHLYSRFVGEAPLNAHDAVHDVGYTLDLLRVLSARIGMTIPALIGDMATPRPYSLMPIGKHKGKLLSDVPKGWANWLFNESNGDLMPDMLCSLSEILDR